MIIFFPIVFTSHKCLKPDIFSSMCCYSLIYSKYCCIMHYELTLCLFYTSTSTTTSTTVQMRVTVMVVIISSVISSRFCFSSLSSHASSHQNNVNQNIVWRYVFSLSELTFPHLSALDLDFCHGHLKTLWN